PAEEVRLRDEDAHGDLADREREEHREAAAQETDTEARPRPARRRLGHAGLFGAAHRLSPVRRCVTEGRILLPRLTLQKENMARKKGKKRQQKKQQRDEQNA